MTMNQNRSSNSIPSRKATILIVGPTPPPYMGPSVATKMILESELNQRFRLIHMDTSDRRSVANIGRIDFTNVYLVFLHIFKLFVLLCVHSPSVVYLPISQTVIGYLRDVMFMLISKLFNAKVVIHLRGGYFRELYEKNSAVVKFIIRSSCKMISRAIVLDNSLRYIFKDLVPENQIAVVTNGIDENFITPIAFNEAFNKRYDNVDNNKSRKCRILFLSNLILTKGYFDIIKAIPEVVRTNSNIEFIFAGDFYEGEKIRQEVLKYIETNHLKSFVKFVGTTVNSDKRDLLLASDIFVFPTYYHAEGQPWVIIEAMAAGLPIISTDQGCIREMVIDGENGFIVEKMKPSQIAEKILLLLENSGIRGKMAQKSRERYLNNYTRDKFIGNLQSVLSETLEGIEAESTLARSKLALHKVHQMVKPSILVIGPVPPPYHGVTVITTIILDSKIVDDYNIIHLDTSDHRDITNIGKLDFQNCWLAFRHTIGLIEILYHHKCRVVYLPICQTILGIIRDGIFMAISAMKKAKVIVHLHGSYFRELYERSPFLGKSIIKRACEPISCAIVVGDSLRKIFKGLVTSDKITVVPVGLDKDFISEKDLSGSLALRAADTGPGRSIRVLYLSNLMPSKGFFDLIKAIPEVVKHNKSVEFVFAGDFDSRRTRQSVYDYIDRNDINKYVKFVGSIAGVEKKRLLLASDVFILPTYYPNEGQPVSILEAMAAGLPIISTDRGAITDMVINKGNGFVVEKQKPYQIAEKILLLQQNPNTRMHMGQSSRERFLKYYTKEQFIYNLKTVFNNVLL